MALKLCYAGLVTSKLFVMEYGEEISSPLVALVHGSLDRSSSFGRVVRHLSGLHVVAYDRRGYHRSRSQAIALASSFEDQVDDLFDVLAGREAVVIGHSYGADIALSAAERDPDQIRAVGAWEPPLAWMDYWPDRSSGHRRAVLTGDDPAAAAEAFFRAAAGDAVWEHLPERTKAERRAEGAALMAELRAIRDAGPVFDVARIKVPVVIGVGSDTVPYQLQGTSYLASAIEGAELFEIKGARHGAHLSHPAQFAEFVRRAVALAAQR